MKKRNYVSYKGESYILAKGEGSGSAGRKNEGANREGPERKSGNIYLDTISSLMEKNRTRVSRYYCANTKCSGNFWSSDLGYRCPKCGTIGVISEFKADKAEEEPEGLILGFLDSIGRIFCNNCAQRFSLGDDVSFIIYSNTEPYSHGNCEVCRADLSTPS
jgi:hypothetical protein